MARKIIPSIAVIASVSIVLVIFLFSRPQQTSMTTEKITLALGHESLSSLVIIADNKNYFHEQGVDVTIKTFKGGKQALIKGLLSGDADLATSADVPIVFNSFNRNDFKIISTIGSSDNEPRIIARKDKLIKTPGDLTGKKIVTKKGSAVHFFLNTFLAFSGITNDDIELSFTKDGHEMVDLLASGKVDAMSHREPFISEAKNRLGDNAVVFEKPGAYTKTFNLIATDVAIKNKDEAIKRVLKALLMAEEFSRKHPADTIKIIANSLGITEESLITVWNSIDLSLALDQTLITTLEAQSRWASSNLLVDFTNGVNYLEHIDASLLQLVKPDAVNISQPAIQ